MTTGTVTIWCFGNSANIRWDIVHTGIRLEPSVDVEFKQEPPYWSFGVERDVACFNAPAVLIGSMVLVPAPDIAASYGLDAGECYHREYRHLLVFLTSISPPCIPDPQALLAKVVAIDGETALANEALILLEPKSRYFPGYGPLLVPVDYLSSEQLEASISSSDRGWFTDYEYKYIDQVLGELRDLEVIDAYVINVSEKFALLHKEWGNCAEVPWWPEYTFFPSRRVLVTANSRLAGTVLLIESLLDEECRCDQLFSVAASHR